MREILFRGKNYDGEWIEGYYVHQGKSHEIYYKDYQEFPSRFVTPETVGQYTGLTDKNGKKIFEGDIIKATDSVPEYNLMVVRNEDFGCFNDYYFGGEKHYTEQIRNADWYLRYKIIGNIHDNPELLGGDKK